jgi:hypothetical protein
VSIRRAWFALAVTVVWVALGTAVAVADPAGPTDYGSEVTSIEPDTGGFDIEIVGGDSFVSLTVESGVTIEVIGYSGEPYLRFGRGGVVEENQLSPSKYLNEDRYASAEVPDTADAEARAAWTVVADNGSYAWHDHRTHWMNAIEPPGKAPGDQVAEGVIPLLVDGVEVDVTVVSVWQKPPSALPVVLGVTIGVLLTFATVRRRGQLINTVLIVAAVAATVAGVVGFLSVPAETGPRWALWALPMTACAAGVVAVLGKSALIALSRRTLQLLGALELVFWSVLRWPWLWAALLPTGLPFWLDRLIGASVLVTAIGAVAATVAEMTSPGRTVSFRP